MFDHFEARRDMKKDYLPGMKMSAFMVAGTHSGCGKTTVSLGIMAALARRGLRVAPFKAGPDFIDPGHHRLVTGRDSHNLDGWMMDRDSNRRIFRRYARNADTAVVEGVMGLYDGFSGREETGSSAQMAKWLGLPVLLVIDARSMARSAAAIALGFRGFDRELHIGGIILNRVGSAAHGEMIREAIETTVPDLPIMGYLSRQEDLEIPSRHLGLVTAGDLGPDAPHRDKLADWIEDGLDLDSLLRQTGGYELHEDMAGPGRPVHLPPRPRGAAGERVRIGIAQDEAFCFYYGENLRLLAEAGATLVPFSPLRDSHLPEGLHGMILGGGYPELYGEKLARNRGLLEEIRRFAGNGRPIYAECGGFMFLMHTIRDLAGRRHRMAGIFPLACQMEPRLQALGYREITTGEDCVLGPAGTTVRGHEFHYSNADLEDKRLRPIYKVSGRKGAIHTREGFVNGHVLGSYIHLHWGSNPAAAANFVECCRK